jgi:ribosomal protein S14
MNATPSPGDPSTRREESRCSGCGRAYGPNAWGALPLIQRLDVGDLVAFANPWPAHLVVEARTCARCGKVVSRLVKCSKLGSTFRGALR